MQCRLGNKRPWLYFLLAAAAAALLVASSLMPWWNCRLSIPYLELGTGTPYIRIYQYGLEHNLVELRDYVIQDETPYYQMLLAWIYTGLSAGLILLSTQLKGNKGRWLLGFVGLGYIAYAAVAIFMVVSNRIAEYDIALTGWSSRIYHSTVDVTVSYNASLGTGYYLAYAAGGLCIALALLRNVIIGKKAKSEQV